MPYIVTLSMVEPTIYANKIENITVKTGERVVVACSCFNSNPAPNITWFKGGYPVIDEKSFKSNIEFQSTSKDFNYVSYYSFFASSSDHLNEIRCDVRVENINRTMHGSLVLQVKCN